MSPSIIIPPIKSQGIKTKLVPWILDITKNLNQTDRWIEPFLGTGVVAFNSGYKEAILNDANPHIIQFYKEIQSGSITKEKAVEYLQFEGKRLSLSNNDGYEVYLEIRKRFNEDFSPLDFMFLSRSGFNGLMRFNRKGKWNVPFCKKPNRFSKSYITKISNQIEKVSKVITPLWEFTSEDFSKTIIKAEEGDIIYCDPPYFGRHVDYYNGWKEEDEELLFTLLSQTKAKFVLSTWHHTEWRKNDMIDKYWNKFRIITKDHFYHNGGKLENRKSVVEALVCNF
jgi:DNA adenine methylase